MGWHHLGRELEGCRLDSCPPELRWPWRQGSSEAWSGSRRPLKQAGTWMMLEETQSLESQRQPPQGLSCGGLWGLPGASQRPSKWVPTSPSLWAPGVLVCLCKAGDLCYLPVALPLHFSFCAGTWDSRYPYLLLSISRYATCDGSSS